MATRIGTIRTFVFMDCETTGFELWSKITELCLVAVQTEHLLAVPANQLPRVLNKLTLCFNPQKAINPGASEITGLNNELLENAASFNAETVELIQYFINHLPSPVCLVAHNGHKFDFPILRNHINKNQLINSMQSVLSFDTLQMFRHQYKAELERIKVKEEQLKNLPIELRDDDWDDVISQKLDELDSDAEFIKRSLLMQEVNETTPTKKDKIGKEKGDCADGDDDLYAQPTQKLRQKAPAARKKLNFGKAKMAKTPSFKLGDVYNRMTGEQVVQSHEAEGDVKMMVKCAAIMGREFVALANEMAVLFVERAC